MDNYNLHNRDLKPFPAVENKQKKTRFSFLHITAVVSVALIIAFTLTTLSLNAEANRNDLHASTLDLALSKTQITMELSLPDAKDEKEIIPEQTNQIEDTLVKNHHVTVKKGDTLTHVFSRAGLNAKQVIAVTSLGQKVKTLTNLSPGQTLDIKVDEKNELHSLVYHINKTDNFYVKNDNGKLLVSEESREYERRIKHTSGTIKTSLFEAAQEAGLSDNLTMDLAYIFGWDIDFALDIRENDSFVLMYEELYLDGEKAGYGNILAAEFVNQGKSFKAVRYTDAAGESNYYSDDGKSMRKAFLRTPVDFTRISSRFGTRYHPILKQNKAHKGVDYAAPRGTPIKASGDGKIIWLGRKGGYGKAIIIQHGSKYSTLYGHMNSYNRNLKSGSRVKQGQIIGYVGSTGRATGPHLHYEFRVNGVHRNPLTVSLPNAAPIKKKYKSDFLEKTSPLLAQLELFKTTAIALNESF